MADPVTSMDRISARIGFFVGVTGVLLLLSAAKLAGIQIRHHEEYAARADEQQTIQVRVEAQRGEILDRNGFLLAGNLTRACFSVYWPNVPPEEAAGVEVFAAGLGEYLTASLPLCPTGCNQVLAAAVPWEYAAEAMDSMPRYVDCSFVTSRVYPMDSLAAPVVGTHSENASQGLEYQMEDILKGTDGLSYYQASAWSGYSAVDNEADNTPPVNGRDLLLTIDSRYQEIAQRELQAAVEYSGSSWGAAVLVDPSTGDILAMASYPVYNEDGTLARNHCVQSATEPGSVFKAITLAAALEGGYATMADSFDCTSSFVEIYGHRINDSHPVNSMLDLTGVIAHSSNVGTVALAQRIPDEAFHSVCEAFGFGQETRIEFPSEQRGLLRDPSQWSGLSRANLAIGQEVSATPLQLAMAYSAIANGGLLLRPRLVCATLEDGVFRELADSPERRVISPETASAVRDALTSVVEWGTGGSAAVPGVTVAGKTGTAERLNEDGYLSAFAGMVPAEEPRLVAVVVFDQPDREYRWGSALAAPVFGRIVSAVISTSPEIALGEPFPGGSLLARGGDSR